MPVESAYGITEREKQTAQQILSTGLYLGVDLTSYSEIQPTTGKALSGYNFVGNRVYGALKPILGRQTLPVAPANNQPLGTGLIGNPPLALVRMKLSPTGVNNGIIAQGVNPQNNGLFFQHLSPANSSALWMGAPLIPFLNYVSALPAPSASPGVFVQASKWVFFSNNDPYAQQYKIDSSFNATLSQIQAPIGNWGAATVSPTSGNITFNGGSGPTYVFTYASSTATGLESSVNIPVAVGPPYSTTAINLNPTIVPYASVQGGQTSQVVAVALPVSLDPQVTTINVYRIDPSQPQYLFVGSVPNVTNAITPGYTLVSGGAGQTAVFVDNTAIGAVTGYPLVPRRDPPAPFNVLFYHKNYMFGFGHPAFTYVYQGANNFSGNSYMFGFTMPAGTSDLWYTNSAEPWGWNSVTQVIPVNPNDYADVAVAGGSLGGIAFLVMSQSAWAFYGDAPEDMQQPQQVGQNLGCVSAASFCIAFGSAFWLSNQGVMMFNASNLQCISNDIKEFLDTCSQADLQASVGLFNDGHYYLSFPTKQVSFGYNVNASMWYPTTFYWSAAFFDLEDPTLRISGGYGALDYVIAVNPASGSLPLCQMFIGNSDIYATPNAITTTWYSGIWAPPDFSWWKVDYLEIEAPVPNVPALTVTVYVTRNPGTSSAETWSRVVTFGQMPSVLIHLPETVQGSRFQIGVQCVASVDWTLGQIRIWGTKRRKFDEGDST
jgi:hypothetical protein